MKTTTFHHRRLLPVLNLLVAGAAVTLSVVAIVTDDVSSITSPPRPGVATPAVDSPAVAALPGTNSGSVAEPVGDCGLSRPSLISLC